MTFPTRESGYTDIDQAIDPEKYIRRLDDVAGTEFWREIKERTYSLLNPQEGNWVLDVGCGTGDDVRQLAEKVGQHGRAIGVDTSIKMLVEAHRRAADSAILAQFCLSDACRLSFPDAMFDGCRSERLLQHLRDPWQALVELRRVARCGARIVAVEPDYGAFAIKGASEDITNKLLEYRRSHFRSSRIGSDLPRLFKALELSDVAVTIKTQRQTNLDAEGVAFLIKKYIEPALKAGIVCVSECEQWLSDLRESSSYERYLHNAVVFIVSGRK